MAEVTIYGSQDTTLEQLLPTSPQDASLITVGLRDKTDSEARGILMADFSEDIAAGSTINTADLKMYVGEVVGETGGTYHGTRIRRTDWEETWATWLYYKYEEVEWSLAGCANDPGDVDLAVLFDATWTVTATGWKTVDVTDFLQDALDNRSGVFNARLNLTITIEEGQEAYHVFRDSESGDPYQWYILVDYTPPVGAPKIGKISGEDWTNVKAVSGVAEASCEAVSGVQAN